MQKITIAAALLLSFGAHASEQRAEPIFLGPSGWTCTAPGPLTGITAKEREKVKGCFPRPRDPYRLEVLDVDGPVAFYCIAGEWAGGTSFLCEYTLAVDIVDGKGRRVDYETLRKRAAGTTMQQVRALPR